MRMKQILTGFICAVLIFYGLCLPVAAQESEILLESEESISYEDGLGSPEERLMLYLYSSVYGMSANSSDFMEDRLTEYEAMLYRRAKDVAQQVAVGSLSDTLAAIAVEDTPLYGRTWSAEQLGVENLVVNSAITAEATAAMRSRLNVNFSKVFRAVVADCPYEMYWSSNSYTYATFGLKASKVDGVWVLSYTGTLRMRFEVSENYALDPTQRCYQADPAKTGGVTNAVNRANRIVARYSGWGDVEKLYAYRDEICALTDYNYVAAGTVNENYGDPWQLIYVFDGDSTTHVVCEGYAKAFQYLCELTRFQTDMMVYTVTGTMRWNGGSGGHMWNLVCLPDGSKRLVDITNSDGGSYGTGGLFMVLPDGGDVVNGYTFGTNTYVYDERTWMIYLEDEITFRLDGEEPGQPTQGKCGEDAYWYLSDGSLTIYGEGDMYDYSRTANVPWNGLTFYDAEILSGITGIGARCFMDCTELTCVTIGDTVQSIGIGAFANCSALNTVTVSEGLSTIGMAAFGGCTELEEIELPTSLQEIGDRAFEGCIGLHTVTFNGPGVQIAENAFAEVAATVFFDAREDSWQDLSDRDYGGALLWISTAGPRIMQQPVDATADLGTEAAISIVASGLDLTYRWEWRKPDGVWRESTAITAGFDSAALSPVATLGCDGYQYRCTVTDGQGRSVTSDAAALHVIQTLRLLESPINRSTVENLVVAFHVRAEGNDLRYQWQYQAPGGKWTNCTRTTRGYNTDTLLPQAEMSLNGYRYRCVITGKTAYLVSDAATLAVYPGVRLTEEPVNCSVLQNETACFAVAAEGSSLTYRWQSLAPNGEWKDCPSTIDGYNTEMLLVTAVKSRNHHQFRCIVMDYVGNQVTSAAAELTVLEPVRILMQPQNRIVTEGTEVEFTVATMGEVIGWQWQYYGSDGDWIDCTDSAMGCGTGTLRVTASVSNSGSRYRCVMWDINGNETISASATLKIANGLEILSQPESREVQENEFAIFAVEALGVELQYQWQYRITGDSWADCTDLPEGSNASTLTVVCTPLQDGREYRCVVTDGLGNTAVSQTAILTMIAETAEENAATEQPVQSFIVPEPAEETLSEEPETEEIVIIIEEEPEQQEIELQPEDGEILYIVVQ